MGVLVILFGVGLVAGFVDAIAGGGGLLTVPALLFAGLDANLALGTNKGQSVWGSGAALFRYSRSMLMDRKRVVGTAGAALGGAFAGVGLLFLIEPAVLRPIVTVLLGAVAVFMIFYSTPSVGGEPRQRSEWLVIAVAGIIGMYDGFFGPGTGTFLILAYALLWRDPLHAASANAKVANFCSNAASVLTFSYLGWIRWHYAIPMGVGQLIGGYFGAHTTVKRGVGLVRYAVVAVAVLTVARLLWQMFEPQ